MWELELTLPDGEADCDGGIEVATAHGGAGLSKSGRLACLVREELGEPAWFIRILNAANSSRQDEGGCLTIMANAMPMAKAHPIWKRDPKTGIPSSAPTPFVVAKVNEATEAIPGNT
jgi:hypothetical protein